jgi:hypothetical protein
LPLAFAATLDIPMLGVEFYKSSVELFNSLIVLHHFSLGEA